MLRTAEIAQWRTQSLDARDSLSLRWSRDHRWLSACASDGRLLVYNVATREHWAEHHATDAASLSLLEYALDDTAVLLWARSKERDNEHLTASLRCVSLDDRSLPEVWRSSAPHEATGLFAFRDDLTRVVLHSPFERCWSLDRETSDAWVSFDGPWHHRSTVRMQQDDTVDVLCERGWERARVERDRVTTAHRYAPLEASDLRLELNTLGALAHNADSSTAWLRRKDGAVLHSDLPPHDRWLSTLARAAAVYAVSARAGRVTVIDLEASERAVIEVAASIADVALSDDASHLAIARSTGDVHLFAIERTHVHRL